MAMTLQTRMTQGMQKFNEDALARLMEYKPDVLDERMARRGIYWHPLFNDWVRPR